MTPSEAVDVDQPKPIGRHQPRRFWFIADRLVLTDRESVQELFPRLALAAEQHGIAAIVAAVDPDLHPLRQEAEQVLKGVKPTQILVTFLEVTVDAAQDPPQAAGWWWEWRAM